MVERSLLPRHVHLNTHKGRRGSIASCEASFISGAVSMAGGRGNGNGREGAGVEGRRLPPRLAQQAPALAAEMRAPPPRSGGNAGAGPSGSAQQPAFAPQMNHLAAAQSIFNFQVGARCDAHGG